MQRTDIIYSVNLSSAEVDTIYISLSAMYLSICDEIKELLTAEQTEETDHELRCRYAKRERVRKVLYDFCDATDKRMPEERG